MLLASVIMLTIAARAEVYILEDDVMGHMFWVNLNNSLIYANQLLLPATVTDYQGNIKTTDALVIYDTRYGDIHMLHYGNYCITSFDWAHSAGHATIAQTGKYPENITLLDDYVYHAYPTSSSFDKQLPPFVGPHNLIAPSNETGKDNTMNAVKQTMNSAASATPIAALRSGFGHIYYLYDLYRIGDRNFEFFLLTMVAQSAEGPADGLMFLQRIEEYVGGFSHVYYIVIITVFESQWIQAYSMAGIYDLWTTAAAYHYFVLSSRVYGVGATTVY